MSVSINSLRPGDAIVSLTGRGTWIVLEKKLHPAGELINVTYVKQDGLPFTCTDREDYDVEQDWLVMRRPT